MKLIDLIKKRKSIRKYSPGEVDEKSIKYILECGRLSPSACNSQLYRFVVIKGEFKDRFVDEVFSGIYSVERFLKNASFLIAVVRIKPNIKMKIGNNIQNVDFSLIDIGIAGEHMILAATELGLGSLWVGWFNKKKADKLLEVKKNEGVEVILAFGYKAEEPPERRKKDFDKIVDFKT